MKVQYEYYTNNYGGNRIPQEDWNRISQKAERRLDGFTFGRCFGDWEGETWCNQAKCAVCEMSEILYKKERREGKTSENIDGYSVSYDTGKPVSRMLFEVAQVYLGDTGLMSVEVESC